MEVALLALPIEQAQDAAVAVQEQRALPQRVQKPLVEQALPGRLETVQPLPSSSRYC